CVDLAPSVSDNIRATIEPGKRVSWVELYLDLVFVLAVGQLAHLLVAHPDAHAAGVRAADHRGRRRTAARGPLTAHRGVAGLRGDRHLPPRHPRLPRGPTV